MHFSQRLKKMKINDLFLCEFMNHVDLKLFTPSLYNYFLDYLEIEKVRKYNNQYIINTFIPPFPGVAFDKFISTYFGQENKMPIQSVDLAVTNACPFSCGHCYNAGRLVADLQTEILQNIVDKLQDLGALVINFTGGEPCLRHDLVDICSAVKDKTCGILATTGYGFTDDVAKRLRETRVYSISISLDSADTVEHDKKRGIHGAFDIALKGIETAKKWGFYTYTCAVPSKKLLEENNFARLVELNNQLGVYELQLIEPVPAGKGIARKFDFGESEFEKIFQYMQTYNEKENNMAVSSFAHMESPDFFGCAAGYSHIYIDGAGEVCPCNMIPVSYGNAAHEDLGNIIERMQTDFKQPYRTCVAHLLHDFFMEHTKKVKPVYVDAIPSMPLPEDEELPRFFRILEEKGQEVAGKIEIITGYNKASTTYDDYWLTVASKPIDILFDSLQIKSGTCAVDCGCGTGYATAKLADKIGKHGRILAIDLSPDMIEKAKNRILSKGLANVDFKVSDILEELEKIPTESMDVAVLTWLIGYVGCEDIFPLLKNILKPNGLVGIVAHLDRSPLVPIEIFEELTREDPQALIKAVKLKFPQDADETRHHLTAAGFKTQWILQDTFDFICHTGREVYDHVMKSGAGTTFYYSLHPSKRETFNKKFIRRLDERFHWLPQIRIIHDYVVGIGVA